MMILVGYQGETRLCFFLPVLIVPARATIRNLDERAKAQLALLDFDTLVFAFLVLATSAVVVADFCLFFLFVRLKFYRKKNIQENRVLSGLLMERGEHQLSEQQTNLGWIFEDKR